MYDQPYSSPLIVLGHVETTAEIHINGYGRGRENYFGKTSENVVASYE